jgi:hypothetical protein
MLSEKLGGQENDKAIEELAEKVNACLDEKEQIVAGKDGELDQALAAYREAVAKATGPKVAHYDMLLKSVPAVADRVRATAPES